MVETEEAAAHLAAALARAAGARAVVCLDCYWDSVGDAGGSGICITLSRPPLRDSRPDAADLLLVVLVDADSDLARRCAHALVPEVWWYDGRTRLLEAQFEPHGGKYRRRRLILPGEVISLRALPEVFLSPLARFAREDA